MLSMYKNQLQRDYITFTEPDKPLIRTDKGTVKRHATLKLYADFIERFYSSRLDDSDVQLLIAVDTSSIESITDAIRHIFASLSPAFQTVSPDTDVFSLGIDSILVFRVIKSIRAVMGLQDRLAPRHLYANPTLSKLSAAVSRLLAESKQANGTASDAPISDEFAKLKKLVDKHKSRLSPKMNPFDLMNPNLYGG